MNKKTYFIMAWAMMGVSCLAPSVSQRITAMALAVILFTAFVLKDLL